MKKLAFAGVVIAFIVSQFAFYNVLIARNYWEKEAKFWLEECAGTDECYWRNVEIITSLEEIK